MATRGNNQPHIPKPRTFVFNNTPFMRVTPSKALFHSTTVYEVITRGDFFAVDLTTGTLTILKGGSDEPQS